MKLGLIGAAGLAIILLLAGFTFSTFTENRDYDVENCNYQVSGDNYQANNCNLDGIRGGFPKTEISAIIGKGDTRLQDQIKGNNDWRAQWFEKWVIAKDGINSEDFNVECFQDDTPNIDFCTNNQRVFNKIKDKYGMIHTGRDDTTEYEFVGEIENVPGKMFETVAEKSSCNINFNTDAGSTRETGKLEYERDRFGCIASPSIGDFRTDITGASASFSFNVDFEVRETDDRNSDTDDGTDTGSGSDGDTGSGTGDNGDDTETGTGGDGGSEIGTEFDQQVFNFFQNVINQITGLFQ